MATARLTRVVRFSAAHRYYRPDWSAEQNRDAFGACANDHGHGHNYRCYVTLEGPISTDKSMVVDLRWLDSVLRDEVLEPLDHRHINHTIPEYGDGKAIPTAESLAVYVWNRIQRRMPDHVTLHRVRIQEDETLFAEYYGAG